MTENLMDESIVEGAVQVKNEDGVLVVEEGVNDGDAQVVEASSDVVVNTETIKTETEALAEIEEKKQTLLVQEGTLIKFFRQLEDNQDNPSLFKENSESFDNYFNKIMNDFVDGEVTINGAETIAQNLIDGRLGDDTSFDKEIASVDEAIEGFLDIFVRIDDLEGAKEILYLANSPLKEMMEAESEESTTAAIDAAVESKVLTEEEGEETKKALNRAFAKADIGLDAFIKLNEGSNLSTFLSFLRNPTGVSGREGASDTASKSAEDVDSAEVVTLHEFAEKFEDHKKVAQALVVSAEKINPSWKNDNNEELSALKNDHEFDNPELTKKLLTKMFTKLIFAADSSKAKENRDLFRLHFTTALSGGEGGSPKAMDGDALVFIVSKLKNEGESLDKLWDIKPSDS